jgi:ubiquinone/menaquinone biosynthesis C-methylase UbiE
MTRGLCGACTIPRVGLYSRYVFPWVLDHVMQRAPIAEQRPAVLAQVEGNDVLEIGFGTGLNLPHYPAGVRRLVAVEPNESSLRRARKRIDASPLQVEAVGLVKGRDLPLDAGRFDCVVSTWTMCSIADVAHALREVHRVLRPGGRFVFIEHGLAPDPAVARWQRRLNPINRRLGDGCRLDRDVSAMLQASPLVLERCNRFYLRDTPKVGGYTYRGVAAKPG